MDDVIVIGAGWSGLAAAAIALDKGYKVRLIAQGIGTPIITPGWISVWDSVQNDLRGALRTLVARVPDHPYALAGLDALESGVSFFRQFSAKIGLPFVGDLTRNRVMPTALWTAQNAALTPPGYSVEVGQRPLFVGFEGWRDYYPHMSGARGIYIPLPYANRAWDATPTDIAREFDEPSIRRLVATRIKAHLHGATSVGFPAVIGLENPVEALADLGQQIGVPAFEVPTLPPSVPGTRLFNKMRRYFMDQRVRFQVGHPVQRGLVEGGRCVGVEVAAAGKPQAFRARAVILATGGLYGGGLASDDRGLIWEPIFGLPVQYDPDRTTWFNEDMLDPQGHAVHYFGLRVNPHMQPINEAGHVLIENLYTCGRMVAHPRVEGTPAPLECSEGVALATAWKAIASIERNT
jgi:glycerol-3-phosphate dehydrogenase subunit B